MRRGSLGSSVALIDARSEVPIKARGPYKPRAAKVA